MCACEDASKRRCCQGNRISDAVARRNELCELLIDADVALRCQQLTTPPGGDSVTRPSGRRRVA